MSDVKYPRIHMKMLGMDGNAFSILGRLQRALKRIGTPKEEIDAVMDTAMSGNYDKLLQTCMDTVNTDTEDVDYDSLGIYIGDE